MVVLRALGVAAVALWLVAGCGAKDAEKAAAAACNNPADIYASAKDASLDGLVEAFAGKPMPDNPQPQSDASAAADATPVDVPASPSPDAEIADSSTKQPNWTPHWLDEHGCEYFEHFDATTQACLPDNAQLQLDELACWTQGAVNDLGVGMPCKPGVTECPSGQKANCCHLSDLRFGAMCTLYCANAGKPDAACGPNSWCAPNHVCVPAKCQAGLQDSQRPYVRDVVALGLACDATPSNGFLNGVGTPCTTSGSECSALKANKCLGVTTKPLADGVSSFCSHSCKADADCGAGASCVYFIGKPYFCVPTSCRSQFAGLTFAHTVKDASLPVCTQAPKP